LHASLTLSSSFSFPDFGSARQKLAATRDGD
jgi:hypothetical protein